MTGNPRCHNPDFLRQIPLQDVAFPDFRCEEGNLWVLIFGVIARTTKEMCKFYSEVSFICVPNHFVPSKRAG